MQIFHVVFPRDQYWDHFFNICQRYVCNNLLVYADDSAILAADKSASNIESMLQNELDIFELTTKKLSMISLIQCHFDYACSFWYHGLSEV